MSDLKRENQLNELSLVIESYIKWFNDMVKAVHAPQLYKNNLNFYPEYDFVSWRKQEDIGEQYKAVMNDLTQKTIELQKNAEQILDQVEQCRQSGTVSQQLFVDFVDSYQGFLNSFRRLEKDVLNTGAGYDPKTGFRDISGLERDFNRELNRRERYDHPFCLVLFSIGDYHEDQVYMSDGKSFDILPVFASFVRQSIRTIDDGYYLGNGEFVVSTKQTTKSGGGALTRRLLKIVDTQDITSIQEDGSHHALRISSCAAEPIPGDKLPQLLEQMRVIISQYQDDGGGTQLEYKEQSPLQRYVTDLNITKTS